MSTQNEYRADYPREPIGGGNPYWRCSCCGRSDPDINGRVEGHNADCEWRLRQEHAQGKQACVAGISVDDPKWDEAGKTHDWRNHVGGNIKALWGTLTTAQRLAIALDAESNADCEIWD